MGEKDSRGIARLSCSIGCERIALLAVHRSVAGFSVKGYIVCGRTDRLLHSRGCSRCWDILIGV